MSQAQGEFLFQPFGLQRASILGGLRHSDALVMVLDAQAKIRYLNLACESVLGCSAETAIGKRIEELCRVGQGAAAPNGGSLPSAGGPWPPREMECWAADGASPRWIAWCCTPIGDGDGQATYVLAIGMEITEHRQAEELLRQRGTRAEHAYAREYRIATRLQNAVLPYDVSGVPGYAIAHTYRPALPEADICGDFYSIFRLDERRLGLLAGDVGGKGLDAGTIAARMRCSAVALAIGDRHPGEVLEVLHRIACLEDPDRVTTLFMGVLEPETGRLCYAGAGHEPAMLLRSATRRVELLASEGPALCGATSGPYPTRELRLEYGDTLLLYTDGLPEARAGRGAEPMGSHRLAQVFTEGFGDEPSSVVQAITRAAVTHSQGRLQDDIAVIVVRRLAPGDTGAGTIFVRPPLMEDRPAFRTGLG